MPRITRIFLFMMGACGSAGAHPSDEAIVLMSLGVHDKGLRYELDMPRSLVETLSGVGLHGEGVDSAALLKSSFLELYRGKNPVFIDGVEVAPRLHEAGILEASREEESTPLEDPLVYVVLEYASPQPPDRVDLTWTWNEVFEHAGQRQPKAKGDLTGAGGFEPIELDRERRLHSWKRQKLPAAAEGRPAHGTGEPASTTPVVPILAIGTLLALLLGWKARRKAPLVVAFLLAAAGATWVAKSRQHPPAEEATRILAGLIEDVYRSFDGRSEGEVYDLLAKKMDGDLLDRTYREIHKGLFLDHEEKKSTVRILSVDVFETQLLGWNGILGDPEFRVRCRWKVRGLVVHTGHVHARTREFAAVYRVVRRDSGWKLADCEVLDLERGAATSLTDVTPPVASSPGAAASPLAPSPR